MLRGRTVICVSTIAWDFLWQGHQAISTILARAGNRVLFVETTGVRSPGWADRSRIVDRLTKWSSGRGRFAPVAPDIFLYAPLALPFPYSPLAQRVNRLWICGAVRRWLRRQRVTDPILLTFLPTQFTLDLIDTVKPALSVFYCTDKLSQTSAAARRLVPYERRLIERCDLVFASAVKLAEHCRRYNPETHIVSTGVSLDKFEAARRGEGSAPADLAGLPRPLVGHVGGLRRCVDQGLLEGIGKRLPGATFVFVGPEQGPVDALRRLPNFKLLGSRPHEAIPAYIREFDACLIPYVVDEFTDHISPAKLNEYLALGKPVVSTGLLEVRRFSEANGGVVAIADGVEDFAAAIERAVHDDGPDARRRRAAVADANAWDLKVEEMSARIEAKLAASAPR
jgi:glycosyltransferase involved in cell wall biosynthesis